MRVAIVHYWLLAMRGGERVVESLCRIFPRADIFTHVLNRDVLPPSITAHPITTTFINKLPLSRRYYRHYIGLMPLALEQLDLRDYDLVISSESGPAKGVLTRADTLHVCYCHTPMRYLWDMYPDYLANAGPISRLFIPPVFHYLRTWDLASASRVDEFLANSNCVARRINKIYRRGAQVIYPPVEVARFGHLRARENFYLTVSALVCYKRVDLVLRAFQNRKSRLVVIGGGPEFKRLKRLAGENVSFLGAQRDAVVQDHMERCRAFVFAGEEDFGIAPVEAQAAGAPVIAYGRGGVLETVQPEKTGLFFSSQSAESLNAALDLFERESRTFTSENCRQNAERFSAPRFENEFRSFLHGKIKPGALES